MLEDNIQALEPRVSGRGGGYAVLCLYVDDMSSSKQCLVSNGFAREAVPLGKGDQSTIMRPEKARVAGVYEGWSTPVWQVLGSEFYLHAGHSISWCFTGCRKPRRRRNRTRSRMKNSRPRSRNTTHRSRIPHTPLYSPPPLPPLPPPPPPLLLLLLHLLLLLLFLRRLSSSVARNPRNALSQSHANTCPIRDP